MNTDVLLGQKSGADSRGCNWLSDGHGYGAGLYTWRTKGRLKSGCGQD